MSCSHKKGFDSSHWVREAGFLGNQTSNTKHETLDVHLHSGFESSAITTFPLQLLRLGVALETDKRSKSLPQGSSVARQPGYTAPCQGISPLTSSYASGLLEQGVLGLLACFPV